LKQVLNNCTAKNISKKKTVGKKAKWPSLIGFSSPEFINILEEKENKKNEPVKRKAKGRDKRQRRLRRLEVNRSSEFKNA
jgi:hypothetical protein